MTTGHVLWGLRVGGSLLALVLAVFITIRCPTQAVSWQTGRLSRRSTLKLAGPTSGLLENLFDDPTMHIGQAIVATRVPVGQSFMIDSQLL